jgi:hypothetical protein
MLFWLAPLSVKPPPSTSCAMISPARGRQLDSTAAGTHRARYVDEFRNIPSRSILPFQPDTSTRQIRRADP